MAQLGITVTSNADQAEPGLRRLVATSDAAEKAAKRLGAANQNLGAGYDRIQKQAAAASATLQRIDRMTGVTGGVKRAAADIMAYGQELDRLRAKYNPVFAASQAYGRELDGINYAHRVGAISASEQAAAIAALDARYRSAAAGADTYRAAAARARAGMGATGANALNLGFQAQDIAMMTLMGQAPGMLALQQGMQVGGIFSQMGSGRAIVQGLGSALGMLLNPLNLATIAVIGLGAAGVQALMGMMGSTEDATSALERHSEWLDEVLSGYDAVRDAADGALNAALKLPQGSVTSDLAAQQEAAAESAAAAIEKLLSLRGEFEGYAGYAEAFRVPDDVAASLTEISALITQVTADARLSTPEVDLLHTAFTDLANTTADQNIRDIANEALGLANNARGAAAQVDSLVAALRQMNLEATFTNLGATISNPVQDALDKINAATPDLLNTRERIASIFEDGLAAAANSTELEVLTGQYERFVAAMDKDDARRAAERTGKSGTKAWDQWGSAKDNFMQRIEQQRLEIDLIGMGTYEVERQRAAFDLLNQAKQAGVQITEPMRQQINQMASEYANLVVEMEEVARAQAAVAEQLNFYRSTFVGFFGDLKSGLKDGQTMWEALGNAGANALDKIADRALSMAANGIFDLLFGSIMGGISGGFGGNPLSLGAGGAGFLGGGASSWGPSFDGGGFTGYGPRIGGIDGKGGFPAILHPRETVIDHTQPANQNSGTGDIIINNIINVPPGTSPETAPAIAREVTKELRRQLPDAIDRHNRNPLRRAG